jgi:hypothetical protein
VTPGIPDEKAIAELKLRGAVNNAKDLSGQTAAGEAVERDKLSSDAFGARIEKENLAKDNPAPQLETQTRSFGLAAASPNQNQAVDPRAPQQVLFFFRIVDAPIARAAIQSQVEAGQTERAKAAARSGRQPQDHEEREATPVPAAPPGPVK